MPKESPDLSICILAHPSREKWFPYFRKKLGNDIQFQIDWESEGNWPNARKAWRRFNPDKKYHLVLQDDALVCDNFYERLNIYLEEDYKAYSLYWGQDKTIRRPTDTKKRGFIINRIIWGVALILSNDIIPDMLKWTAKQKWPKRYANKCDDTRISRFVQKHGYRCCFPIPSLVDHRTEENISLTDASKSTKRFSPYYIDK